MKPQISQYSNIELLAPELHADILPTATRADMAEWLDMLADYGTTILDKLKDTPTFWNAAVIGHYADVTDSIAELASAVRGARAVGRKPLGRPKAAEIQRLKEVYAFNMRVRMTKLRAGIRFIEDMRGEITDTRGKAYWWLGSEMKELLGSSLIGIRRWVGLLEYQARTKEIEGEVLDPAEVYKQGMAKVLSGASDHADG